MLSRRRSPNVARGLGGWRLLALAVLLAVALAGCSDDGNDATESAATDTATASTIDQAMPSFPLGNGFEATDDECRIAGESDATVDFLDDSSTLVACPVGSARIGEITDRYVGTTTLDDLEGFTLLSVPIS